MIAHRMLGKVLSLQTLHHTEVCQCNKLVVVSNKSKYEQMEMKYEIIMKTFSETLVGFKL